MSTNRPDGEIRASSRKAFSFSLISYRFSHRCLSVATLAAIEWAIAWAICWYLEKTGLWLGGAL